jgi:hypothetical protein
MAVQIPEAPLAAGIGGEILALIRAASGIFHHHIGPCRIDVDVERIVDRIGHPGAGWSHVDLQRDDAVVPGLEQLDVEEALAHVERLQDLAAGLLDRRADPGKAGVAHVAVLVDHLHHALVVAVAGGQHHLAVTVDQSVKRHHQPLDELLHDEGHVLGLVLEELVELLGAGDLEGVRGAGA